MSPAEEALTAELATTRRRVEELGSALTVAKMDLAAMQAQLSTARSQHAETGAALATLADALEGAAERVSATRRSP